MARLTLVTVDCADADALGAFHSRLLGWPVSARDGVGWLQLRNPEGGIGLRIQADVAYDPPVWPERPGCQTMLTGQVVARSRATFIAMEPMGLRSPADVA